MNVEPQDARGNLVADAGPGTVGPHNAEKPTGPDENSRAGRVPPARQNLSVRQQQQRHRYVDIGGEATYEGARAISPAVESGASIEVEFTVFRKRICSAVVRRWLTDATGVKHSIPGFTIGLELLAGRETYRRSITITQAAVVGPASYQVIIDYTCNPLQMFIGAIRVESPPIMFVILPTVETPPAPKLDGDV